MILNAKELIDLTENIDKECLEFSKGCLKNIKKAPNTKKYVYKKQVLMDFKLNKFKDAIKK